MGGEDKTNECFMPCLSMQQFPRLLRSWLPPMALGVCCATGPRTGHRRALWSRVGMCSLGAHAGRDLYLYKKKHGFGQALPYLEISWEEHLALLKLSQNCFQIAQTRYRKPEPMYTASQGNFLLFWHFL